MDGPNRAIFRQWPGVLAGSPEVTDISGDIRKTLECANNKLKDGKIHLIRREPQGQQDRYRDNSSPAGTGRQVEPYRISLSDAGARIPIAMSARVGPVRGDNSSLGMTHSDLSDSSDRNGIHPQQTPA